MGTSLAAIRSIILIMAGEGTTKHNVLPGLFLALSVCAARISELFVAFPDRCLTVVLRPCCCFRFQEIRRPPCGAPRLRSPV